MNKKNHLQRKQNKGFTLVELLIAMTILAIIVVPLLHAFVTSSRTNAKAKQLMKATTIAQNVMEEVKANSLEEIARQFNGYPSSNSLATLGDASEATWDGAEYVSVTTNASVIAAPDPDKNPEGLFVGQTSGNYCFLLEGVTSESAKFDVVLEISKNAEGTRELTQINAMNQADCGYYAEGNVTDNATLEFKKHNTAYQNDPNCKGNLTEAVLYSILNREITVDIISNLGNETVNVTYDYVIDSGYTEEEDRFYSESITIFDNYLSNEKLKAVYLYFDPIYECEDSITIKNNNNLDVDVYLIQMNKVSATGSSYAPNVVLHETSKKGNADSHANICTNIPKASQRWFDYTVFNGNLQISELGNKKNVDCFYDIKISVYKHNSEPFKEANRIATFTGSLMDNSNKVDR